MNLTDMGQVQTSMRELLDLHLEHLFSAADLDDTDLLPQQRCGTLTALKGYTEWRGQAPLPISIGWDWRVLTQGPCVHWLREEWPRTNIQLMDEAGRALKWDDNLRVLATWVDAHPWQNNVRQAVTAE